MKVYSLTETNEGECYGVYSSVELATAAAMNYIKDWDYDDAEETIWNGFSKCIYYGGGCFGIYEHYLDDSNAL